jgi:hypothetical protein
VSANPSSNQQLRGFAFGLLGVLCFSLTLPATRVAVASLDRFSSGSVANHCAGIFSSWQEAQQLNKPPSENAGDPDGKGSKIIMIGELGADHNPYVDR